MRNQDKGNGGKAPSAMETDGVVESCAETTEQVGYRENVVNADDGKIGKVGRAW